MSGKFVILVLIVSLVCMNCGKDSTIKVKPSKEGDKIHFETIYDARSESSTISFFVENKEGIENVANLSCTPATLIHAIGNGEKTVIYFLRNKNKDSLIGELWRFDAHLGNIEKIQQASQLFIISENGQYLCDVWFSGFDSGGVAVTDLLLRKTICKYSVDELITFGGRTKVGNDYFVIYPQSIKTNSGFVIMMDHLGENGPLSFSLHLSPDSWIPHP